MPRSQTDRGVSGVRGWWGLVSGMTESDAVILREMLARLAAECD